MLDGLKAWARSLKVDLIALWFASRHPQTPLFAKAAALLLVAYAFSPIDLIPDFVPVLGYLDDLIILPAGIWLLLRLIPAPVLADCRGRAARWLAARQAKPRSYTGLALILAAWAALAWFVWLWLAPRLP